VLLNPKNRFDKPKSGLCPDIADVSCLDANVRSRADTARWSSGPSGAHLLFLIIDP
jgi:hypothetical protein